MADLSSCKGQTGLNFLGRGGHRWVGIIDRRRAWQELEHACGRKPGDAKGAKGVWGEWPCSCMSKSTNVHGYYYCRWAEKGVYSGWKDTLGFKLLPMSVPSHHSWWQERRWRSWWSPWWWWWSWTPRTSLAHEGPPSSRRAFMSLGLPAGTARLISHKRSIIYNCHIS